LAAILRATSIGLLHVAGSATTRPLRGPDVQRNFLLTLGAPPLRLSLANTPLDASSTPQTVQISSSVHIYGFSTGVSTYYNKASVQAFSTGFQYICITLITHITVMTTTTAMAR